MNSVPLTVTIHYRRKLRDYTGWKLSLSTGEWQAALAQLHPATYTSFGALYRFQLPTLFQRVGDLDKLDEVQVIPFCDTLSDVDQPPRILCWNDILQSKHADVHYFIVEGHPGIFPSPSLFHYRGRLRFVATVISPLEQYQRCIGVEAKDANLKSETRHGFDVSDFWIVTLGSNGVRKDCFPASKVLRRSIPNRSTSVFIHDLEDFPSGSFSILVCRHFFLPYLGCGNTECAKIEWRPTTAINCLHLSLRSDGSVADSSTSHSSLKESLMVEASTVSGMSNIYFEFNDTGGQPGFTAVIPRGPACQAKYEKLCEGPTVLKVFFHRLQSDADDFALLAQSVDTSESELKTLNPLKCSEASSVFILDTAAFSSNAPAQEITLWAYRKSKKAREGPSFLWTPDLGFSVELAESFGQLRAQHGNARFMFYHRFGKFEDWGQWKLRIWFTTKDKISSDVKQLEPRFVEDGTCIYDITEVIAPDKSTLCVQPMKMAKRPGSSSAGETGETSQTSCSNDVIAKDVIRTWVNGEMEYFDIHIVQGNASVSGGPPQRSFLESRRFFNISYRRFEEQDYADWDLWTWDEGDGRSNNIAILPLRTSLKDLAPLFLVDRAKYGSGSTIHMIPRRGGVSWKEKDEPAKIWTSNLLESKKNICGRPSPKSAEVNPRAAQQAECIPTYFVIQASKLILEHLEDARSELKAEVLSSTELIISSPIPFEWLPLVDKKRNEQLVPSLHFLHVPKGFREAACDKSEDRSGAFKYVKRTSHTELVLVLEDSLHIDEDFPIEDVEVGLPGFEAVRLSWRHYEDWDMYYYKGELGWSYQKECCLFRCFAPTASQVSLVLYEKPIGDDGRKVLPMRKIWQGCWKVVVHEDLNGKYYKLLAEGEDKLLFPGVEVIDPYSKCNTSHTGRGLIFANETTPVFPRPCIAPAETIVYELHVRDATIDEYSGVVNRGKFLGLTERGTKLRQEQDPVNSELAVPSTHRSLKSQSGDSEGFETLDKVSTGLDHIAQMGVTAVQIMPIQDFDNDEYNDSAYRWGYMPVHFNSPDGWYASSPAGLARITEFKMLVDALHKAGLKVIMDVVYNHTAEDSNERNLEARFSFNGLAPRYYYRTCGNTPVAHSGDSTCAFRRPDEARCGACYSNGSGCGNEFRSEAPMGRKFLIDSICYWAREYCVDGFRFDLLGLVDLETITQVSSALRDIDPNIVVYGEPWAGGLTPIPITGKGSQRSRGFGFFNNGFRDAIRGSPFGIEETFVMDGGRLDSIKKGLIGSVDDFCDSPLESVNYVECHDNYTLWDHMQFFIKSRTDDIDFTEHDLRRMHALAAVIVFASQGIPFIQIGQEMCRTKFNVENSYESPDDINKVRWRTKLTEWRMVKYFHGLITLRKSHPEIFCMTNAERIRACVTFFEDIGLHVPHRCIALRIKGDRTELLANLKRKASCISTEEAIEESMCWTYVVILLNPNPVEVVFPLPDCADNWAWIQVVDDTRAGVEQIRGPAVGSFPVPGRSAAILRRASDSEQERAQLELRLACISDAYTITEADDILSSYAVSLCGSRSRVEARAHDELVSKRVKFNQERVCSSQE